MKKLFFIACLFCCVLSTFEVKSQNLSKEVRNEIGTMFTTEARKLIHVGRINVDSVSVKNKLIRLYAGADLSYLPLDRQLIDNIYTKVKDILPAQYKDYKLEIISDKYNLEQLIPLTSKEVFSNKLTTPLVSNVSKLSKPDKGLSGHHLAMWQSHGWYYEQKLARWEWQRARIFQTVEDLYTQSYVLPFLVPMLENAGANVLLPRERDTQKYEIILDNDKSTGKSEFREINGKYKWKQSSEPGFAHLKDYYQDGENPFIAGTYNSVETITKGEESLCEWIPDMPSKGSYAVYVSYKTLKNSTKDARYTVYHLGGKTEFSINQAMGGSTWIFLGFFDFENGLNDNCKITLSNKSSKNGYIVTADAVKIGGGMGNIARMPNSSGTVTENTKSSESESRNNIKTLPKINYEPEISGYPRYTEAARYWMQWAGVPDSIYSKSTGKNDYTDDYQGRGLWVNYLAGGSSVLPKQNGLNIPIDLAMAFHTDAGTTFNDSIIGTLGINMTHVNDEKFANGKPRILSRDLNAIILDEIITDIRNNFEPQWTRRQIWNKSYSEARNPEVPTMLLELLSHQNLADMKYGHDPRFRFLVSRAIYKGMLKFIAHQYKRDYVVQPLPVDNFSTEFSGENKVLLKWEPTEDKAEPTAKPSMYIVYTRVGNKGFDNGILVSDNHTEIEIEKDSIYSFKITAVNDGGESFPSEILSVCRKSNEKGVVLVINGFDRLSAPFSFSTTDSIAGFVDNIDHGVDYIKQYNYIGSQYEFRRQIPWMDDDAAGFGASNANYETMVIAGNTFDYPFVHGQSISNAGYSYVSCSDESVMSGQVHMDKYKLVDLILGKQKQTMIGRNVFGASFKTFPAELQKKITAYCNQGGNIFISGAFVGTDLWDSHDIKNEDKEFAQNTLRYKWRANQAAVEGKVKTVASPFPVFSGKYEFHNELNPDCYVVESPDAIEPVGNGSHTVFRYSENNLSAGIVSDGDYKTVILGFPFETIKKDSERNELMQNILDFIFK